MKNKFKIGDKVRIRRDSILYTRILEEYNKYGFIDSIKNDSFFMYYVSWPFKKGRVIVMFRESDLYLYDEYESQNYEEWTEE